MPFDFPLSPVVGDVYTSGGATYSWDGLTWNLGTTGTDFVLKSGDTMTGTLYVSGAASEVATDHRLVVNGGGDDKVCLRMYGCEIRRSREGDIELWTDNGGFSTTWGLKMVVDNPPHVLMKKVNMEGGINFGSRVAASTTDVSQFIRLWTNTSTPGADFGFCITSGQLNYNTASTTNNHKFFCGGVEEFLISDNTITIGTKLRISSQSYGMQFHLPADTDEFVFNLGGASGGDVYKIDNVGSTGNIVGRATLAGRGEVAIREEVDVIINELKAELAAMKTQVAALLRQPRR